MSLPLLEILKRHQLSVTDSRKKILELFQVTNGALAHADIEKKTGEMFDRVTIYRTLQTFVDKGIIHTIPTADNSVLYALCKDDCSQGHHHDNHVHFICDNCNITYCLDHVTSPTVHLPIGFKEKRTDVVISGICINCN
ncbi:MAG TPA: transcriptional repressor [Chitinophagaceae bacterium]|jgi:Fur family ferric uptake transcriptional regulator|nr:transcriptional repressor [Chitinophagaceae bacterium]MBP9740343.1 transcriptional repressor [Chitinophagaceae bacterium]HPH22242.1 transcriptional repressor [Chitinophagaceae bacterium]